MGAPYGLGLGGFADQLTADEMRRAFASAGGQPDELDLGALPASRPAPGPAPAPEPQPASFGTRLSPEEEQAFQRDMRQGEGYRQWYDQFTQKNGGPPVLDDPDYDYRAAWKAGIRPAPYEHDNGAYHWASALPGGQMLKSENHPTAWMEHFMRATGKDPNDVGVKNQNEALEYISRNGAGAQGASPDVHVGITPMRTGTSGYDRQWVDTRNQRIDLAGRGGAEEAATHDKMAGLRGEQAAGIRSTNDAAKARIEEARSRELRHRDEADKLYDDMRAHAMPPDRKAVEKVLGVIGAVMAMGGNHGMAVGASMLGSLIGSDRERWALEQESNSNLYRAALQGVGADQGSQQHEAAMAGNIAALDAHYYEAALEQAKEQGLSDKARRVATDLQLDLREKGIEALRSTRVADMQRAKSGRKTALEEYFWRLPIEQLREMPSQVLGSVGYKVLEDKNKIDQGYREKEATIRKAEGAAAGGPEGADERKLVRLLGGVRPAVDNLRSMLSRGEAPPHPWAEKAPDLLVPEKTLNQEADMQAVADILLRDESGAAIGEHEAEKKKRGWGITSGDPDVRRRGLRKMLEEYDARLNSVAGGGAKRALTAPPAGADPRVRPGFAAPSAASRGISTGLPAGGVTIDQIRAADQQQAQDDAQRDAVQNQLARWAR